MAVMGKYYVHYKADFKPPRELGRACAERMIAEITTDNAGVCRFHRGWSEKLWPEIVCGHFKLDMDYGSFHAKLALAVHRLGKPVYWESARIEQLLYGYLRRVREMESSDDLESWIGKFESDRRRAAREYWEEVRLGAEERMGEIPE
jgi:glyceraldehyde-3-phosphate dehydrogenase (ferredoxin)